MNLKRIYQEIKNHPSNRKFLKIGYLPVYQASPSAKIVIVGQAPGRVAQETGIPWNDVSGDTLRNWLGIGRDVFYDDTRIALVPMDFYFPGKGIHGDLPPRKGFAPLWHPKIFSQMPRIELVILVGSYAQKYYLGDRLDKNLTQTVKAYSKYLPDFFPIVHPSPLTIRWRSLNPWFEKTVISDLRNKVNTILGRSEQEALIQPPNLFF